jgi:hypothetical protein
VRRWEASGPDIAMTPSTNMICSLGAAGVPSGGGASLAWHPGGARSAPCWPLRRPRSPTKGSAGTPNLSWSGATWAAPVGGAGGGPGNTALEPGGPAAAPRKPRPLGRFPGVPSRWAPQAARAFGVPAQERLGPSDTHRLAGGVCGRGAQSRSARRAGAQPAPPGSLEGLGSTRASAQPVPGGVGHRPTHGREA